jgi:hypothetical protein
MKPQRWLPPPCASPAPGRHGLGLARGPFAWRSASILSAWAGCGALLASLVLMVRDPRFAAALGGLDSLYRWHHRSGTVGYCLLLIHPWPSPPTASTNPRGWPGRRSRPWPRTGRNGWAGSACCC